MLLTHSDVHQFSSRPNGSVDFILQIPSRDQHNPSVTHGKYTKMSRRGSSALSKISAHGLDMFDNHRWTTDTRASKPTGFSYLQIASFQALYAARVHPEDLPESKAPSLSEEDKSRQTCQLFTVILRKPEAYLRLT